MQFKEDLPRGLISQSAPVTLYHECLFPPTRLPVVISPSHPLAHSQTHSCLGQTGLLLTSHEKTFSFPSASPQVHIFCKVRAGKGGREKAKQRRKERREKKAGDGERMKICRHPGVRQTPSGTQLISAHLHPEVQATPP